MAAITGTKVKVTQLASQYAILIITAPIGSSSDTIDITPAAHGCKAIIGVLGAVITAGLDAAFSYLQVARTDDDTLTVKSFEEDGTPATDFTGTTVEIALLVEL